MYIFSCNNKTTTFVYVYCVCVLYCPSYKQKSVQSQRCMSNSNWFPVNFDSLLVFQMWLIMRLVLLLTPQVSDWYCQLFLRIICVWVIWTIPCYILASECEVIIIEMLMSFSSLLFCYAWIDMQYNSVCTCFFPFVK